MQKHILSKSTFMRGCQCPLSLYLHKFRPELRNPLDEDQQAIYQAGTNIGLLAQQVFPGGINAEPPDSYSYHISVEKTKTLIEQGTSVIYEAAFNFNGLLCAIDILVKKGNKWLAYEVKNTTKTKPQHIMDAAFQYYVMTACGLQIGDIFIMHLNNTYVKRGEIDLKQLFTADSIKAEVLVHQEFIHNNAKSFIKLLSDKIEPKVEPGPHCEKPYPCDFTNHCWKDLEEEEEDYGKLHINKTAIKSFIKDLQYPLFYFDFETVSFPVPVYDESRPYQQVPFQFSLHVQRSKTSELEHFYFLGDGKTDPLEALVQDLIQFLGPKGSVLVWYAPFEVGKLRDLARDFPKYEGAIQNILDRIVDLIVPFKQGHYRHPEFKGSNSIKDVLPVLVPELSYHDLEIQEGNSASAIYASIREEDFEGDLDQIRQNLLDYCHLDTLAMVKILDKLKNVI